jgi:putative chitinase
LKVAPQSVSVHGVGGFAMLTSDNMREMWPHGDVKVPGLVDGIMAAAATVFAKYGLTSDLLIAHAMAQFSHECGTGNEVVENLNYSAQGLMDTWPGRFDAAKAAAFAHDQRRIANEVYNGRMNNRVGTDDGWTYRGRGGSQVTGHDGYQKLGERVGLDLINEPDLANDPRNFLECAVADFVICGCLPFAAHDDISGATFHLNGGHIGLPERTVWLARWKAVLNGQGAAGHGAVWVQQAINKLGTEPPLIVDGVFGPATAAAVKAFQLAHGLDADGKVDPQTVDAMEQALATA